MSAVLGNTVIKHFVNTHLSAGHVRGTLREQCSGREPEGSGALQPLASDRSDCGWRGSAGLTFQSEMTRH